MSRRSTDRSELSHEFVVKLDFSQRCLHHLHHHLALTFGHSYGARSQSCGDRLRSEACASLSLFRFKISKSSDLWPGHIDADVLGRSVGVADKGYDATGSEDAIKITTCCFGQLSSFSSYSACQWFREIALVRDSEVVLNSLHPLEQIRKQLLVG